MEEDDSTEERFQFLDSWYGQLDDIIEDLESNGYDVLDSNNEYIVVSPIESDNDEDVQYVLYLGGTNRTIYIDRTEVSYV